MADASRYRIDDLRRWAAALAAAAGVRPPRASGLASQLLWYDAAGAPAAGLATLPGTLDALEGGKIDPGSEGVIVSERGAAAAFDGRKGVPLLALERAAGLAVEKSRDTGVGLVRVSNIGPLISAACIAAELAVGPTVGFLLGPDGSAAVALPGPDGLPLVVDPSLVVGGAQKGGKRGAPTAKGKRVADAVLPVAAVLVPDGGWLVAAVGLASLEPLTSLQVRVGEAVAGLAEGDGLLLPGPWEDRRRAARSDGVPVDPSTFKALRAWSDRYGVVPPEPK